MSRRNRTWAIGLAAFLSLLFLDLLSGGVRLGIRETLSALGGEGTAADIVWGIRIPRILSAMLAGASLGLSGMLMQAVFRNPLADPHIMGVSGGAGLGAALATGAISGPAIGTALGGAGVAGAAFIGAILSSILILAVSYRVGSSDVLLIFGVMLGFVFSALTSIVEYTADETSLKIFYGWTAGHFTGTSGGEVMAMALAFAICLVLALASSKGLDIVLFGDDYAALAGANVRRIRFSAMAACCVATGAVTAFCGPIGFIGIIAPHIARRLKGSSVHRRIIPASVLGGASLALIADALSSALPRPLPVGSTIAVLGIPMILIILLKGRR